MCIGPTFKVRNPHRLKTEIFPDEKTQQKKNVVEYCWNPRDLGKRDFQCHVKYNMPPYTRITRRLHTRWIIVEFLFVCGKFRHVCWNRYRLVYVFKWTLKIKKLKILIWWILCRYNKLTQNFQLLSCLSCCRKLYFSRKWFHNNMLSTGMCGILFSRHR